jgi:hypothetical protein
MTLQGGGSAGCSCGLGLSPNRSCPRSPRASLHARGVLQGASAWLLHSAAPYTTTHHAGDTQALNTVPCPYSWLHSQSLRRGHSFFCSAQTRTHTSRHMPLSALQGRARADPQAAGCSAAKVCLPRALQGTAALGRCAAAAAACCPQGAQTDTCPAGVSPPACTPPPARGVCVCVCVCVANRTQAQAHV